MNFVYAIASDTRDAATFLVMAHENDLRALATLIIEECGEDARLFALHRASKMQSDGDAEHAARWTKISDIIAELEGESSARPH